MYIRCKRLKTTIFVEVDPKETILEVKGKLQKLLDGKVRFKRISRGRATIDVCVSGSLIVASSRQALTTTSNHFAICHYIQHLMCLAGPRGHEAGAGQQ